jgi:hypothetical protein
MFSSRRETISDICTILMTHKLLLNSAPPMSGKSSLCDLLIKYIRETYPETTVIRLNCAGLAVSDYSALKRDFQKITNYDLNEFINNEFSLLILDDSQLIFSLRVTFFCFS